MAQKLNIQASAKNLSSLLDNIKQGSIQVPPFQREFVWERKNIKRLFDSINKGYPIGTIFLWHPVETPPWDKKTQLGAYSWENKKTIKDYYVLDGYQRLSALFGCLVNYETNAKEFDLQRDENEWNRFFSLYYDTKEDDFVYMSKGQNPNYWQFPMWVLLSANDFRKYTRIHIEKECSDEIEKEKYIDKADRFSAKLQDYRISIIDIDSASINQAAEIFSRINYEGTKVSLDWMVHALSYDEKSGFNLAEETDKLLVELQQYNFDEIRRNIIFRCYQNSFGKAYFDQDKIEDLARGVNFKDVIVKETIPAIKEAVKFLYNEVHVIDQRLLPYGTQLVFCCEFFRRIANPSVAQREWLKDWFWKTTYSSFFTIGSLAEQRKEYERFTYYLDYGVEGKDRFVLEALPFPNYINLRGVRSCALALFVINHLFKCCPKKMERAIFHPKYIEEGKDSASVLFTDVEFNAYKESHLSQQLKGLLSCDEFNDNHDIMKASFFDFSSGCFNFNAEQVKLRKEKMRKAESEFIVSLGFKDDDQLL